MELIKLEVTGKVAGYTSAYTLVFWVGKDVDFLTAVTLGWDSECRLYNYPINYPYQIVPGERTLMYGKEKLQYSPITGVPGQIQADRVAAGVGVYGNTGIKHTEAPWKIEVPFTIIITASDDDGRTAETKIDIPAEGIFFDVPLKKPISLALLYSLGGVALVGVALVAIVLRKRLRR